MFCKSEKANLYKRFSCSFINVLVLIALLLSSCDFRSVTGSGSNKGKIRDFFREGSLKESDSGALQYDNFFRPGDLIPEMHLELLSGEVGINSLRDYSSGNFILLNFWASWCVPCVKELPLLEKLHKEKLVPGLKVISINTDAKSQRDKVKSLAEKYGISFSIFLDPELESVEKFHLTGYPETFFIDTDGRFLLFNDPKTGKDLLRVLSDRNWVDRDILDSIKRTVNSRNSKSLL
ncbi:MAG TPA: TlpA disulfide reductase family protein [Oligoflexia bacterium]|nr:TlpA disulfide reductase family protein [Oligoflexia bacterium]HMP47653.1 TlpA disulfide reductase family protein [Oligoflexia bacterium]